MIVLSRAKFILLVLAVVVVLALGVSFRQELLSWTRSHTPVDEHAGHDLSTMAAAPAEREILYWYDPMHPAYKSDKPGVAPDCGMQLVPKYADEAEAMKDMPPGTVMLSAEKQQLIGVRTSQVRRERLLRTI